MPGFDRTGPEGQGSRTGRQMGKCSPKKNNAESPENFNENKGSGRKGRGFGRAGRGSGRGAGRRLRFRNGEDGN